MQGYNNLQIMLEDIAKKRKPNELFDAASDQRTKAISKGGASISLAASRNSFSSSNGTMNAADTVPQSPVTNTRPPVITGATSLECVISTCTKFGMQQRKTGSKLQDSRSAESQLRFENDTATMQDEDEEDAEYKAVYHQVYKGTLFASVSTGDAES